MMLTLKPVTDSGMLHYLWKSGLVPADCDFCYLAQENGAVLAAAAFAHRGEEITLLSLCFADGVPDSGLADGLLRASLNFGELQLGAKRYFLPEQNGMKLTEMGFVVEQSGEIEAFFGQVNPCCG